MAKNKRLTVLSETERFALYGLPDFDTNQRMQYLIFTDDELSLMLSRKNISAQVYCSLQIGYFKAKHTFFRFSWEDVEEDLAFVISRYFNDQPFVPAPITKYEYYEQRRAIADLFGYRLWTTKYLPQLERETTQIVYKDVTPSFIVAELIAYLKDQKIVRPGYTTLQTLIGDALSFERSRLEKLIVSMLDDSVKDALDQLVSSKDTLLGLAALKQDAKHFGYRQMVLERKKLLTLEPIYRTAKALLPQITISLQNLNYYASLANFYTIYDLRRLRSEHTSYLYLLCYAWLRYRQLADNLVDALDYRVKLFDNETKAKANKKHQLEQARREKKDLQVGRLLLIYVDDEVPDTTPFGAVRQCAFNIMSKDELTLEGQLLSKKPASKLALYWQFVDDLANRVSRHLRPICIVLKFSSNKPENPWIAALEWMRSVFTKQKQLSQRPLDECPKGTVPRRLRPYLLIFDETGTATGVNTSRYEFWIYRQLRKRLKSGEIYLDDSMQHRCLADELVSFDEENAVLNQLNIPWLKRPLEDQLKELMNELHRQWLLFNSELRRGKLIHLKYDPQGETLTWRRPRTVNDKAKQERFYDQMSFCDVSDVFRFVDDQCRFMSALTPLQPRYAKQVPDRDSLMAVIIAQAMNHGNLTMSQTSDIPYHVLETSYQQYLRLDSLQSANDRISNAIAELPVFPLYSFDLNAIYGSVDGQKFEVDRPTVKARHSRKYFNRGRGVVAYTLLCNHVPLQGWLIGAHEFEAHHVFDVWYQNTSDIVPTAITGDMHSVNKANFAIMHWFGPRFEPRFTNLQKEIKQLYCCGDQAQYEKCLIRPAGQIDLQSIIDEKANINRIVATLGLKEMTQSALIRKLCNYTQPNPTRRAIFEFDKLIRSIYTLRYLRDPQLQKNVHRSQNRIESYHQLRSAIAQVGGKKELTGKTDIEIEISNQCARLIANIIIYYNFAILSRLFAKYEMNPNQKILSLIQKISPVAWRHINLNGHYTFRSKGQVIDLDAIIASLVLE